MAEETSMKRPFRLEHDGVNKEKKTKLSGGTEAVCIAHYFDKVLLLLAASGFISCEGFVRLARTCKSLYKTIITDEEAFQTQKRSSTVESVGSIWAILYLNYQEWFNEHGIPDSMMKQMGYLRGFQQFLPKKRRTTQRGFCLIPDLGEPILRYDEIGLIGSIVHQSCDKKRIMTIHPNVQTWMHVKFEPFAIEKPLVRRIENGRACLSYKDVDIRVHLHLVRLSDYKSCCIYEDGGNLFGHTTVRIREGNESRPPYNIDDLDILPGSNEPGSMRFRDGGRIPISTENRQGLLIRAKYPYVQFGVLLTVEALPDKTIAITGMRIAPARFNYRDVVTLRHLLSNLHYT